MHSTLPNVCNTNPYISMYCAHSVKIQILKLKRIYSGRQTIRIRGNQNGSPWSDWPGIWNGPLLYLGLDQTSKTIRSNRVVRFDRLWCWLSAAHHTTTACKNSIFLTHRVWVKKCKFADTLSRVYFSHGLWWWGLHTLNQIPLASFRVKLPNRIRYNSTT